MLPFATPLAPKEIEKLVKYLLKSSYNKNYLYRGRKACIKNIKKGVKGFMLLPSDISPMDLISHIPAYCRRKKIPFFFVRKKILKYSSEKRNLTTCVMIADNCDKQEYKEILNFIITNKIEK